MRVWCLLLLLNCFDSVPIIIMLTTFLAIVAITSVLYNKRIGTFEDPPNALAKQFYESVCSMFDKSSDLTIVPPYYKYIKTKAWKEYCQIWDTLFQIAGQLVNEEYDKLKQNIDNNSNSSTQSVHLTEQMEFLPYILSRGELNMEEITGNVIDLMIGGVDTVTYTAIFTCFIINKSIDLIIEYEAIIFKIQYTCILQSC